ncbi:hypothetical protein SERLA73DRAFT_177810 [Serpula lacrymans var. lacrymans S7.3]|uniref:Uncharacterized protein n=2 Tax=Serpula lacrymans var. lacrymans TaxID=341189 RepID=F8PPM1_SERL3|nr:uncharacterized protein SERLADRAFT_461602 [Serpula lacrymans var. lacrymans S7.9]EGO02079.1 hypothetical protein SERLA73DRAFT_177810 [Serpula lacrymans var. lacrymans S7.3]EGO27705.1 hypothetical protein SERLADRAFT_461602 [Serpula lacrymans var. lacrymans S7.9]
MAFISIAPLTWNRVGALIAVSSRVRSTCIFSLRATYTTTILDLARHPIYTIPCNESGILNRLPHNAVPF